VAKKNSKRLKTILFLVFIIPNLTYSKVISICDTFPDYCSNLKRNQSRPTNSAAPTQSAAVFSNPAAVSTDKGFGVESIHFKGGEFGLVTGSGRVGAAISNNPSSETFFGNGAQEDVLSYRKRWFEKTKFKTSKFVFSGAANVFGKRSRKGLHLDIGVIVRNIPEIETTYVGGGVSINWSRILSFGYSEYRDAYVKDFRNTTLESYDKKGVPTSYAFDNSDYNFYEWHYQVRNYVVGFNYKNFSFDYSWLTTTNLENNEKYYVKIFNTSLFYGYWMFTAGFRNEESPRETYDYDLKELINKQHKSDMFLGAQYALGNHFVLGLFNNYYLLDEWSVGLTYFF
jgi:hypothetical protein